MLQSYDEKTLMSNTYVPKTNTYVTWTGICSILFFAYAIHDFQ